MDNLDLVPVRDVEGGQEVVKAAFHAAGLKHQDTQQIAKNSNTAQHNCKDSKIKTKLKLFFHCPH